MGKEHPFKKPTKPIGFSANLNLVSRSRDPKKEPKTKLDLDSPNRHLTITNKKATEDTNEYKSNSN